MTVSAILNCKPSSMVTISPDASLTDAVKSLSEHRIGAIVAVDDNGRLAGILSERDVVRILGVRGPEVLSEPVSAVMTRAVVTCARDETIQGIMERMTRGRFRHVPVVEGERLIGIISIGDVVKFRVEEMERESAQLRDYIMTA